MKETKIPLFSYLKMIWVKQWTLNYIKDNSFLITAIHKHLKIDMSHKETKKVVEKYVDDYVKHLYNKKHNYEK